jgi:hypothetical protein
MKDRALPSQTVFGSVQQSRDLSQQPRHEMHELAISINLIYLNLNSIPRHSLLLKGSKGSSFIVGYVSTPSYSIVKRLIPLPPAAEFGLPRQPLRGCLQFPVLRLASAQLSFPICRRLTVLRGLHVVCQRHTE